MLIHLIRFHLNVYQRKEMNISTAPKALRPSGINALRGYIQQQYQKLIKRKIYSHALEGKP